LFVGHRLQREISFTFSFSGNRLLVRQRRVIGKLGSLSAALRVLFKPLPNYPSFTARVIQADVDQQSVEPCIKTGSAVKLFDPREGAQKGFLREILGFFSVMGEIESDPKCLLHIFPHQNLKNFALSLLAERYDLLIPKVLLSSLVHLESIAAEPASG
jgi:hypothetical protein